MTEQERDLIKQTFSKIKNIVNMSYKSTIKNNPQLEAIIENELILFPEYETQIKLVKCIINNLQLTKCHNCGKLLTYENSFHTKSRYCSLKCAHSSDELKEKKKKTLLKNYGVEFGLQNADIKKKAEQTNIKRYGTRTPASLEEIKEKTKKICREKYGSDNPMGNTEIQNKSKKTCIERYGVDIASKSESVKKMSEKTCMERYGVKSTAMLESTQEKAKATNKQKYGVDWAQQNKEINQKQKDTNLERYGNQMYLCTDIGKEKAKQTLIERYGVDKSLLIPEVIKKRIESNRRITLEQRRKRYGVLASNNVVIPLFSEDEYVFGGSEHTYRWKCLKCGNEFEQNVYTTGFGDDRRMPRCLNCYPISCGFSRMEKEVVDFIKSICLGEIIENNKRIIAPLELDIYLPEKKIAIEFDGLFWHSDAKNKDNYYHLNKTELCKKQDIQLIHIFEDEWTEKQDIVKDRIKSLLNIYDRRIYARKCIIKEVNSKESNEFLEQNHLQGRDSSSIRYGLYFNNELVSVMTFGKPRFNKNYDFEMIRFCSKLGIQVIGGASKLLKHFQKHHTGSIISYADKRYSIGKLYESIGFKLQSISAPNYWWTKQQQKLSRYQCQKHKLRDVLGEDFNPELSESENMLINGYDKIYDCGNVVFGKGIDNEAGILDELIEHEIILKKGGWYSIDGSNVAQGLVNLKQYLAENPAIFDQLKVKLATVSKTDEPVIENNDGDSETMTDDDIANVIENDTETGSVY